MRSLRFCLAVSLLMVPGSGAGATAQEPPPGPGLSLLETVHMTLERDPNLALEQTQRESARGSLAIASGQFDPIVSSGLIDTTSREPISLSSRKETRTLLGALGLSQQLRTGLSIEPQISLLRSEDVTTGSPVGNEGT